MCIRDRVKPAFQLLQDRVKDYTPEWAATITGIPVETIRRLAHEMGTVSYTHLRAHETVLDLVCRLLLEKKKNA